jgi:serine/alanine adding enzyme
LKNHIISEYVRFSPWLFGYKDFEKYYKLRYNNQTFFIDLRKGFFMEEYSSRCRGVIRKALKNNVEIQFDFSGETSDEFLRLFKNTVEKNKISNYYTFTKDFMLSLFEMMRGNVMIINAWYEGICISSSVLLYNEKYIHGQLNGNDYEYVSIGANSLVQYEAAKWAKYRNIAEFHLGGASHESLLKYKKSLTKNGFLDYYVGTRIRDQKAYDKMVALCGKNESGYFPEYR